MGENKNTYKVLVEETEGKYLSEDLDTAGRIIILKWILKVPEVVDQIHMAHDKDTY
jgi:hypothetical protein